MHVGRLHRTAHDAGCLLDPPFGDDAFGGWSQWPRPRGPRACRRPGCPGAVLTARGGTRQARATRRQAPDGWQPSRPCRLRFMHAVASGDCAESRSADGADGSCHVKLTMPAQTQTQMQMAVGLATRVGRRPLEQTPCWTSITLQVGARAPHPRRQRKSGPHASQGNVRQPKATPAVCLSL